MLFKARGGDDPSTNNEHEAVGRDDLERVRAFQVVNGLRVVGTMYQAVPCPLPGYTHLTALYDTSTPTRFNKMRPLYGDSAELRALRGKLADLDEQDPAYLPALEDVRAAFSLEDEAHKRQQAKWLTLYLKGFEGWDFGRITGKDKSGKPVTEPIPAPSPDDPESYHVLFERFEALWAWVLDEGRTQALAQAIKNL